MLPFPKKIFIRAKEPEEIKKEKRLRSEEKRLKGDEAKSFYDEVLNEEVDQDEVVLLDKVKVEPVDEPDVKPESKVLLTDKDFLKACDVGDEDTVEKCIDQGLNVDARDQYGWTALMVASCSGRDEVVRLLLANGADMTAKERQGRTALDLAQAKGRHDVIEAFYEGQQRPQDEVPVLDISQNDEEGYCDVCQSNTHEEDHRASLVHKFHENAANPSKVPTLYGLPESNRGFKMMLGDGWNRERGLGPAGKEGSKFPVRTTLKRDRLGLGSAEGARKRVTHFAPGDPASVAGPPKRKERQSTMDGRQRERVRRRGAAKERLLRDELSGL